MNKYQIEHGTYGPRLILHSAWTDDLLPMVTECHIVELELNYAKLWPDNNINFLHRVPDLLSLDFVHWDFEDLSPITSLHRLKHLQITSYSKSQIDFGNFPELESCSIEWSTGLKSLMKVRTLKRLAVNRLPKAYIAEVGSMALLEHLSLLSCSTPSLEPLCNLVHLRWLRLALFRKLTSNAFLSRLQKISYLWVQSCGGFGNLNALASLPDLEELVLDGIGKLDSILPLKSCSRLKRIVFMGGTKLMNPNEDPLTELPQLERFVR